MKLSRATVTIFITGIFIFSTGGGTTAAIIDSDGYFLDTNTGWYWYSEVGEFANQDWETAQDNIDNLTKGGMIWELASVSDIQTLSNYYIPDALLLNGIMPFTTPNKSIWGWLNDEGSSPDHKAVAGLFAKEATPKVDSAAESSKHPWVGAFAVAKPGNTPPQVP